MDRRTTITVVDVPERNRYEALDEEGNLMGFAEYRLTDRAIRFEHAETLPAYRGRGVAGIVARKTLADARDAGLRVIPVCPYYETFIEEHPEYADLVDVRR